MTPQLRGRAVDQGALFGPSIFAGAVLLEISPAASQTLPRSDSTSVRDKRITCTQKNGRILLSGSFLASFASRWAHCRNRARIVRVVFPQLFGRSFHSIVQFLTGGAEVGAARCSGIVAVAAGSGRTRVKILRSSEILKFCAKSDEPII